MMNTAKLMKDLPIAERPYEKCGHFGAASLTDAELLGVILRTGSQGENAVQLANRLLMQPENPGLEGLFHQSLQELCAIRGIGRVKAVQLLCVAELSKRIAREKLGAELYFHDPQTVAAYYMEEYRHEEQEKVLLLMLDNKGRLLGERVVFVGTVNASLVSPREIFLTALKFRAVSVILLHNHPSGDPTPSTEDLTLTGRVAECGAMLGITLTDHIIIGDQKAVSFRQENLL